MSATRSALRWALVWCAASHTIEAIAQVSSSGIVSKAAAEDPVACTSHNDCVGILGRHGDEPHACFFNTLEKSGYCFPNHSARMETAAIGTRFLEVSEGSQSSSLQEAATGATGAEGAAGGDIKQQAKSTATEPVKEESGGQDSNPATIGDGRLVLHASQGQSAMLDLASGDSEFALGNKAGSFVVSRKGVGDLLVVNTKGDVAFNVPNVGATSLTSETNLAVNGVPQWRVAVYEDYDSPSGSAKDGWTPVPLPSKSESLSSPTLPMGVSKECGVAMLGGPGIFNQAGSVSKVFTLDKDIKLVRVVGEFHFIDEWSGQSGFLKAATLEHGEEGAKMGENQIVWTKQYAVVTHGAVTNVSPDTLAALNICGNPDIGEHLFSAKIDAVIPVRGGKVKLTFGSTWELQNGGTDSLPCSWGISGLRLLRRD